MPTAEYIPAASPRPHSTPEEPVTFTETERNSMRTYLARCEVRLSTLHRIATAFIGGAGLLLLIPVFFRDVVDGILTLFLAAVGNAFPTLPHLSGIGLSLAMYVLLLYPLALSLIVPLYGVYLLLKDIIHFYFTLYVPGYSDNLLIPTFSLHAIAFPSDESDRVKGEVMRYQYQNGNMNFMIAFSEGKRHQYFDNLIKNTQGEILPQSRRIEYLIDQGWLPEGYDPKEVNRFNAAFGIARSLDRTLVEEVAITEMALVRAVTYLRRLVLRYVKTLLMFIWTTTVSFLMLPFLHDDRFPVFLVLALGYTAWSLLVVPLIHQPLRWIYRYRIGDVNEDHIDVQLSQLENIVTPFCHLALVSSFAGLALVGLSMVLK